jgi:hypothetical protein
MIDEFIYGGVIGATSVALYIVYLRWLEHTLRQPSTLIKGLLIISPFYKGFVSFVSILALVSIGYLVAEHIDGRFEAEEGVLIACFGLGFIYYTCRLNLDTFLTRVWLTDDGLRFQTLFTRQSLIWQDVTRVNYDNNFDVLEIKTKSSQVRVSNYIKGTDKFLEVVRSNVPSSALKEVSGFLTRRLDN